MNPEAPFPDGVLPEAAQDGVTPDEAPAASPAPTPVASKAPGPDLAALLAAERVANDYHP